MTFDPAQYHPDWSMIRRQILDQAGHACEFCGAPNSEIGDHDREGLWWELDRIVSQFGIEFGVDLEDCGYEDIFPRGSKPVEIVLTIAHLCHDKPCIDPTHLRALCQRCHINLDRPHHLAVQAENRRRRKVEQGQLEMIS